MGTPAHDAARRPAPRVDIVIPSFNGRGLLQRCLAHLARQTYAHRVIVVDNHSGDASAAMVRERFPDALVIENRRNLGFAAGCNVGLRRALAAGADYLALLNQDTEPTPTWLAALVEAAEADLRIGAVASRMLFATHPTLLNSTGLELNQNGQGWDRGFGRTDDPFWQTAAEVVGASGGAMLLRASALRAVGLLDPRYFAYYEDLDLSLRLREAGYRIVYAPAAAVLHRSWHVLGVTSTRREVLLRSNRWRLFLKHFPLRPQPWAMPAAILRRVLGRWRARGRATVPSELRVGARIARGLCSLIRYRAARALRGASRDPWWCFVLPPSVAPPTWTLQADYHVLDGDAAATTARLLMGVNDVALGAGWSPLTRPGPAVAMATDPALRRIDQVATCFLRVAHPGPHVVQLHVKRPADGGAAPRLTVRCNGALAGSVRLAPGAGETAWLTAQFPVDLRRETATIELRVEPSLGRDPSPAIADAGVGINEVSLLSADSPLLRASLQDEGTGGGGQDRSTVGGG